MLYPVAGVPSTMVDVAGWYAGGGRRVLLTQLAEGFFGEPMILLGEAGRIQRAYGFDDVRLLADDGTLVFIAPGHLRLATPAGTVTLTREYHEERVRFSTQAAQLTGTLVRPTTPGPHPAAVVLHGAAFGQRDSCRLQAEALLAAGVAVLIYDKPGHGDSTGPAEPSIFDQADAAVAGLAVLRDRPGIDPDRVGLAGFSNGMWSAPMAAARLGDVAFIVGLGSPGVSMAASEVHRRSKALRDAGVGPATVAVAAQAWRLIFALASGASDSGASDSGASDSGASGSGASDSSVTAELEVALRALEKADDLSRYEVPEFARHNPMLSPIPPLVAATELVAMLTAEPDPQLAYDPVADYARLTCPVLLQYGSEDTSVPVAESVRAIGSSGATRVTTIVYPGLEHMANVVPTDIVGLAGEEAMYQFHDFHFGATVFADLTAWLRQNVVER